jgi:hypothetical protein
VDLSRLKGQFRAAIKERQEFVIVQGAHWGMSRREIIPHFSALIEKKEPVFVDQVKAEAQLQEFNVLQLDEILLLKRLPITWGTIWTPNSRTLRCNSRMAEFHA